MQIPNSSLDGARSRYETQRQQSLKLYELQRGIPAGESLLTRLVRRLRLMLHRPARRPELTWKTRSAQEVIES